MPSEADKCREFVVPKLQAAGWDTDPHRLNEQVTFTDGRMIAAGSKRHRGLSGQGQLLGQTYGRAGFNVKNIWSIELPIPDTAEQVWIVDRLNRVEARVHALDRLRDRTDTELSALLAVLDRAFRGEL